MILLDEDGNKYEVPDDAAKKVPKHTRGERLHALIVDVLEEAVKGQRIAATVQPHETQVNLGTAERPRVESFACSSQPTVDAKLLEPVNPQAIAATIITRLRVHGFIEEDFNAPIEPSAKAAAKR